MTDLSRTSTGQLAAGPPTHRVSITQAPSGLAKLRLTEPVRLYLYGLGTVVLLGLVLAGVITEDWRDYGISALAVVLGLVPATEAARSSVYSLAGHLASLRQLRTAIDVQTALGENQ